MFIVHKPVHLACKELLYIQVQSPIYAGLSTKNRKEGYDEPN
jgi:hypothetical protein